MIYIRPRVSMICVDLDQTPKNAASDQGLQSLPPI